MAFGQQRKRLQQRGVVEFAAQTESIGQQVDAGLGFELFEKPEPLLRKRQRRRALVARRGDERWPSGSGRPEGVLDHNAQPCHRGCLEQLAQRDLGTHPRGQPRDHLGGQQGMTAQLEEVVVRAEGVSPEQFLENSSDQFPDWMVGIAGRIAGLACSR